MTDIRPITRPRTLKDIAYKEIRTLLSSGQIESASIITATQFADILGVSRTPVREALLQLAGEGFLDAINGRGFKIKEFSGKEIRDFFETRMIIECHIVSQLVGSLKESDFSLLEEELVSMQRQAEQQDTVAFLEIDRDFHSGLVRRHNNLLLESIVEQIRFLISTLGHKALASRGRSLQVVEEHARIIAALKTEDRERAVEAMKHHLDVTEREILENIGRKSP